MYILKNGGGGLLNIFDAATFFVIPGVSNSIGFDLVCLPYTGCFFNQPSHSAQHKGKHLALKQRWWSLKLSILKGFWLEASFFYFWNWTLGGPKTPHAQKYLIDWEPGRFIQIERRAKNQQITKRSTSLKCSANDPVGPNEGGQYLWFWCFTSIFFLRILCISHTVDDNGNGIGKTALYHEKKRVPHKVGWEMMRLCKVSHKYCTE